MIFEISRICLNGAGGVRSIGVCVIERSGILGAMVAAARGGVNPRAPIGGGGGVRDEIV